MNTTHKTSTTLDKLDPARRAEVLQARFGLRVGAALAQLQQARPRTDIDERLRVARDQALARARESRRAVAVTAGASVQGHGGAAVLAGGPGSEPWWLRLSSLVPLAVLLVGLVLIDDHYTRSQIEAAVEVDAAILADDLPPEAYRDPGFVEFLKSPQP
jgi:hypothetical protein